MDDSEYRKKTIKELKEFITRCNESRSAAETFEFYKKHNEKDNTDNMVKLLDNIQTNYVTVTKADSKIFEKGYIPTPLELYQEYTG